MYAIFIMKPARKIAKEHWMLEPEIKQIFSALSSVLIVGGAVRNTLMGHPVDDVDLATPLTPDVVTMAMQKSGALVIPTGIDHGTVTVVINKKSFEITTLRRDVEADGRRATIAFSDDWAEDAARRDFTINTLLMDLEGQVYDPLGLGLDDIEAKRVKFVGDPSQRIAEDYLRILRYFRFHAQYANGEHDQQTILACRAASDKIQTLSRERITTEFFKILAGPAPQDVLSVMFENEILSDLRAQTYAPAQMGAVVWFQKQYNLSAITTRMLVLAGYDMGNIRSMEKYILFPKVFLKDMGAVLNVLTQPDLSCDTAVRASIYRFGRAATAHALLVELAMDRVMNQYAPTAFGIIQGWPVPNFPISGHDLMARGVHEGPQLGEVLRRIEDWWISRDFKPDKNACLAQLEA